MTPPSPCPTVSAPDAPATSHARPASVGLWALVAVQLAILPALVFIDYGWRGPGQFGLRVDHQLLLGAVYVGLWIVGMVWAVRRKAWTALAVEALAPMLLVLWQTMPGPALRAADNQDLVGKTRDEVAEMLSDRRGYWEAESVREDGARGTVLHSHGIDVILADERRVTRLAPGRDPVPTSDGPPLVAAAHQDVVGMPYLAATDTLLARGGIAYWGEHDAIGDYIEFNGVRMYVDGEERVERVTPAGHAP